MASCNTKFV